MRNVVAVLCAGLLVCATACSQSPALRDPAWPSAKQSTPDDAGLREAQGQDGDAAAAGDAAVPNAQGEDGGADPGAGIVSPFGAASDEGNLEGAGGGLGASGTGWVGGGGRGEGTIGMGSVGTLGHGTGTGSGYGSTSLRERRPRPLVRVRPPQVTGPLARDAVRRVVLRNLGQVAYCYEQSGARHAGLVTVRFLVFGNGRVISAAPVGRVPRGMRAVAECVARAVRRWQFPSSDDGRSSDVRYPFQFMPPE